MRTTIVMIKGLVQDQPAINLEADGPFTQLEEVLLNAVFPGGSFSDPACKTRTWRGSVRTAGTSVQYWAATAKDVIKRMRQHGFEPVFS